MKAIETKYKGYRFRSRLEARFAILFDQMNIDWDYEPEGFELPEMGWYLPDFFVRYPSETNQSKKYPGAGYWIEVKGGVPTKEEAKKCMELHRETGHKAWLFYNGIGKNARAEQAESFYIEDILGVIDTGPFPEDLRNLIQEGRDLIRSKDAGELYLSAPISMCCPGDDAKEFYPALSKARSARFEHGETPC